MGRGDTQAGGAELIFVSRRRKKGGLDHYFALGLRPDEARAYKEQGVDPLRARDLARAGIGPGQAKEALRSSIPIEELGRWIASGIPVGEIDHWRDAGFTAEELHGAPASDYEGAMRVLSNHFPKLIPKGAEQLIECFAYWKRLGVQRPFALWRELQFLVAGPEPIVSADDFLRGYALTGSLRAALNLGRRVDSADVFIQLRKAGIDDEPAAQLAGEGVPVDVARRWHQAFPDRLRPGLILSLHRAGIGPEEYMEWQSRFPELSMQDLQQLGRAGVSPQTYALWAEEMPEDSVHWAVRFSRADLGDPRSAGGWLELAKDPRHKTFFSMPVLKEAIRAGIEPHHVQAVSEYGLHWESLCTFVTRGGDPDEYLAWQEHPETRGLTAASYMHLKKIGMGPKDAGLLGGVIGSRDMHGFADLSDEILDDLNELLRDGADPRDVRKMREFCESHRDEIAPKRRYIPVAHFHRLVHREGLSLEELDEWIGRFAGRYRADALSEAIRAWRAITPDPDEARAWDSLPITWGNQEELYRFASEAREHGLFPGEALAWMRARVAPADVARWQTLGITDPEEAEKLASRGFSAENLSVLNPYVEAGIPALEAASWLEQDLSVDEALVWREAGISDGEAAAQWVQEGISPERAAAYEGRRRASGI